MISGGAVYTGVVGFDRRPPVSSTRVERERCNNVPKRGLGFLELAESLGVARISSDITEPPTGRRWIFSPRPWISLLPSVSYIFGENVVSVPSQLSVELPSKVFVRLKSGVESGLFRNE